METPIRISLCAITLITLYSLEKLIEWKQMPLRPGSETLQMLSTR